LPPELADGARSAPHAPAGPPHDPRIPPGHFVPGVAGQYQQAPAPLGGGLVKAAWFRHCTQDEVPAKFDRIVQSWDTASKASELSDFSVCTTWGILGKNLYLLDVLRRRMEYPS
jgi:hypothetical protein